MKNKIKILFFLSTFVALLTSFSYGDKGPKPLKVGKIAPLRDYEMKNIDGSNWSLDSALGEKGLLVVFSCNTCPFVVGNDKFPGWEIQYNDLYEKALSSGVTMILVNSNEAKREKDDAMDAMKSRAEQKSYKMPYLVDQDSKLANAFGAKTTPHVYLFDHQMKLVYTGSVDNSWDPQRKVEEKYLSNALDALGSGKKIATKNTDPRGCSIKRK